MSKRLILHIGTHKTGTSALQAFAHHNPELLSAHDIYYPINGKPASGPIEGHHLLAWSVAGRRVDRQYWPSDDISTAAVWEPLLEEIHNRPESTVLISSEEFSLLHDAHVEKLQILIGDIDVLPVIYLRRFDDYLQALYATNVLMGDRRTVDEYVAEFKDGFSPEHVLSRWRSGFGASLVVRPFHRSTLISESVITDLLWTVGIPDASEFVINDWYSSVNSGVPWNIVECARVMNTLGFRSSQIRKLWHISHRIYGTRIAYELLQPSQRKQLIDEQLPVYQREFRELELPDFWRHMTGSDLPDSDANWRATHRGSWSFLVRTATDVGRAYGKLLVRRYMARAMPVRGT